jgi:hypothetical protein
MFELLLGQHRRIIVVRLRRQFCHYYALLIGKTWFFVRLYDEELLTEAIAFSSQQLATQGWSFVSLAQNVTLHL